MCVSRAVGSRTSPQIVTVQLDPLPQNTHMTNKGYGFMVIFTIIYKFSTYTYTKLQSYSMLVSVLKMRSR